MNVVRIAGMRVRIALWALIMTVLHGCLLCGAFNLPHPQLQAANFESQLEQQRCSSRWTCLLHHNGHRTFRPTHAFCKGMLFASSTSLSWANGDEQDRVHHIAQKTVKQHILSARGYVLGVGLTFLMAAAALNLPRAPFFGALPIAPAIYAILLGMAYGNSPLHPDDGGALQPGLSFSKKRLLRAGICLYGFRIAFQQVLALGPAGLLVGLFVMASTSVLAWVLGTRLLGLSEETALLLGAGCSVCGVTAVLAAEPAVGAEQHQTAMAVATVVLFGTLSMFLYPFLYGRLPLDARQMGIYTGATVHELAGVVAAGGAMGAEVCATAVVTKLTRVMLLGPYLVALARFRGRRGAPQGAAATATAAPTVYVPWFALGFVAVSAVNSLGVVPRVVAEQLRTASVWLLHMALAALGVETNLGKVRGAGLRPILLDLLLFVHLAVGGLCATKLATGLFG
mmetsp:Transcript_36639/g.59978  ORF Transcript_36639/g.59978 Transcript_36639/m.59978 type:complete len:454 (+) Transcript_36639:104-1465(+)